MAPAEKELFPARAGRPPVTEEDLATYARDIAEYALPHLKDRPLVVPARPGPFPGPAARRLRALRD
ncbi:hypothetical protein [Streptomyces sp. HPF1205]|uniref:hypothetical protein n=1 Tax=Streptomyces sp. HPF1205 TaxID=2873262 RepID=UPI001CED7A5E|nr:hypothetical protein [Streptomyces sp. HPF1205]